MRTRLKDIAEVTHYWANKVQGSGRAGNVYFEGDKLYSYGSHFIVGEHLPDGSVAITTRSYSMSTGSHISDARSAARHLRVRRVPIYDYYPDAARWVARAARDWIVKAEAARLYKVEYANNAITAIDEFIAYCEVKGWSRYTNSDQHVELLSLRSDADALAHETPEQKAKRAELQRKRREREAAQKAERERQRLLDAAEKIELWRTGAKVYGLPRLSSGAMLRLMPVPHPATRDEFVIETSWGAEVPATHAWRLWPLVQLVKSRGVARTGMSKRVGHYTLTEINEHGGITVGCHHIAYEELERIHTEMLAAGFEELPVAEEVEDEEAV